MGHVVADVTKDTPTIYQDSRVPIVEEHEMSEFVEWSSKDHEQCRWHDQAISVHRQIMVNAVQQEVQRNPDPIVWKPSNKAVSISEATKMKARISIPVDVEEKSMHAIFNQGPETKTENPVSSRRYNIVQACSSHIRSIRDRRKPKHRYYVPRSLAQGLEKVPKERGGLSPFVMARTVDLL